MLTTPEFGRRFRSTFADNSWRYHLHFPGTGVGPSDPDEAVDWVFCRDYRLATLTWQRRGRRRSRLIDFVDYGQEAVEPEGPVRDISLRASPWQKSARPGGTRPGR